MHSARIVSRILVVLGAAGAASCGSSDSTTNGTTDATSDAIVDSANGETANDAVADSSSEAASDAGGDTTAETLADATPDTATDDGGDAQDETDTGFPCPRRPFLVGAAPRAGSIVERDDWSDAALAGLDDAIQSMHAPTRRALAAAWREEGRQEHASIAAFARFTMLELAVGAPPEIVAASNRAGLDEIRHARGCFALADRYEGASHHGPGPIALEGALQSTCLAKLAALTVHEGCVGETIGVLVASEQHAQAKDPAVRAFLDRLVRDEMRHAELAWSFVRWALANGGGDVRRAVERAFDEAIAATIDLAGSDPRDVDVELWHAHGRLTVAETHAVVRRGVREILAPCRAALLAPSAPSGTAAALGVRGRLHQIADGADPSPA